jgi:MFS family permease
MSLLDVSIVAVALPSIQNGPGASPAAVQWVVSGYALTFGIALVPAGRLGAAFGRRRSFRHLAGVRAVLPDRAGMDAAAVRARGHAVRAGLSGVVGDRRPADRPVRAAADRAGAWSACSSGSAPRR